MTKARTRTVNPRGKSVAIVGLGYVGLPLAEAFIEAGFRVFGVDNSDEVCRRVRDGQDLPSHVDGPGLARATRVSLDVGTDYAVVGACDAIFICVPTPLTDDKRPDLTHVRAAAQAISAHLKHGALVVLESTTFPGTTEDVLKPILENGVRAIDQDFYLAFSPERIDPGNKKFRLENTPKLVSGVTEDSGRVASKLYSLICKEVVIIKGTREAEMAKLLENTYRHVNIGLANEIAVLCRGLGIDVWEVIRGASTKPFGFEPFRPGAGVGGHCIPIDPHYLEASVRQELGFGSRFIALAQEVNAAMPVYVVRRIQDLLNDRGLPISGSRLLVLGLSYKPNVADTRESPAFPVISLLLERGALVYSHDPLVTTFSVGEMIEAGSAREAAQNRPHLVVLLQAHDAYLGWDFNDFEAVLDTTGRLDAVGVHTI